MSEETNKPGRKPSRPKRKPITGRNRMTFKQREGYYRRAVSARDPERIKMFQEAGYKIVEDKVENEQSLLPSQLGSAASCDAGNGAKFILMEIEQEYYDEDQKTKQERIDENERAIFDEQNKRAGHYGSVTMHRTA